MQRYHLHLLAVLIVAVIFSFTTAWEFVLEDLLIHGVVGTHGEVSQAHKWEFIGAATVGAIIAAGIFNLIGLRIFADRDNADERYHRVVDLCPEAMWVSVDQKLVFANAAYIRQMRAGSIDDLIGKSSLEFIHPDSRDRYNTLREAFLTGQGQIQSEDVKRRRLDGTEYIGEYSVGHTIWNGKPAVQIVCRDITERKQSTEALLQSEIRFRGLIDIATDAVISIDLQGNIQLFNHGAEVIFGHNTEDILGKPLNLLLPERFRSGHGHHLKQFVQSPEVSRVMKSRNTIYGMRKDGSEFPAEASISKLALPTGAVLTVMLRDITERHLAEEKLQESEARYRRVVTLSPDATFIQSDYKLVFANDAFLRQVGAGSLDEVIGKSLYDFIHPDHRDLAVARRDNMFASNSPIAPVEVKRLRLDGSEYYAEIAAARLTWDGKPAAQVVCRDITERKKIETELQVAMDEAEIASHAKSEFLAGMSHELRTPLNAIIGFSDIMKKEALGPVGSPRYREYAGDIHSSGQHLLALINDILDISKIEAGEGELHEDNVNLADLARSCVTMIKERAHKDGIALMTDGIDGKTPLLRADPRRLKQILINLMSNAVKFTEAGGTVTIKVWHNPDSGYVIQCIDTGIGIAIDDIPKALAQFQQIDGALSRQQEGTGLGLPLTKSLVELHGGTLDLQSQIGKGTTVTVKLPVDRTVSSDGIAQSA